MESGSEEIQRLRRGMRDVAAIAALPTVWANYDLVDVADSLAAALVHMLGLRFVYVCVGGPAGRRDHEVVHTHEGAALADRRAGSTGKAGSLVRRFVSEGPVRAQPAGERGRAADRLPPGLRGRIRTACRGLRAAGLPDGGGTPPHRRGGQPGRRGHSVQTGRGPAPATGGVAPYHAVQHRRRGHRHRHPGASDFHEPGCAVLDRLGAGGSRGQPLESIFRIVNEHTRQPADNPAARAL